MLASNWGRAAFQKKLKPAISSAIAAKSRAHSTLANTTAASSVARRTMGIPRPVWSAIQPQRLGATILVACSTATSWPIWAASKPRWRRYGPQ